MHNVRPNGAVPRRSGLPLHTTVKKKKVTAFGLPTTNHYIDATNLGGCARGHSNTAEGSQVSARVAGVLWCRCKVPHLGIV
jgi:hypothetical protein